LVAAHPIGDRARRFRAELGLAIDRPIVMTGHQAELWHPGIVAKFFAADAAARAVGRNAAPACVIADQDDPPANTTLRWPDREPDGRLVVRTVDLQTEPAATSAFPFVAEGLRHIQSAWAVAVSEPSAPRRLTAALATLISPYLAPPAPIFASTLSRTSLFQELVAAMAADPAACCETYNAAARVHPAAGIRPLVADEVQDRYELPLWHLRAGDDTRRRVYAESLGPIPPDELAPRALLLTGLLRVGACDLFIHGTGGGGDDAGGHDGYDRVTEDWLAGWARSNQAAARLLNTPFAPAAVVTATRLLPLIDGDAAGPAEVTRAVWAAHHARHDPAMLGEPDAARLKADLVAGIAAAPRHSRERRELFVGMHELLERIDRAHTAELCDLAERARETRAILRDAVIAEDRTWPFPLYPAPIIRALHEQIEAAFRR
jgi:hypothetical protein